MENETRIDFLYLNEEEMIEAGVLDAGKCVEAVADAMELLSSGDCMMGGKNRNEHGIAMMFPKESEFDGFPLDVGRDRRFMAMPAYVGGRFHIAGEKWYGSNSLNKSKGWPRSILMVMLNDIDTGAPLALMSANLLSAMRTGAMPGLAAKLLANEASETLALIGPGVINRTSLMAILANIGIKRIKIKGSSPSSKNALALKAFIEETYPQVEKTVLCASDEECVEGADIVSEAVSVVKGQHPRFKVEWLKKGSVVISSGSMEFPDEGLASSLRCVVDNVKMYEMYQETWQTFDEATGERIPTGCAGLHMVNACDDGLMRKEDIQTLGNILRGLNPGRVSPDETFFVGVGGMPILDVAWGHDIYHAAMEKGIGTKLKLWESPFLS
ncbi:MAG: ornithine cyclodeaminase [Eubacteriaceae bacterium]|jgi:ornithine cyclodeaminase|nr:ornithine cyclodeaminase [Eubacteriaceae bacterium]